MLRFGNILVSVDADGKVLRHEALLYGLDDSSLQVLSELGQRLVLVQLGTMLHFTQTT